MALNNMGLNKCRPATPFYTWIDRRSDTKTTLILSRIWKGIGAVQFGTKIPKWTVTEALWNASGLAYQSAIPKKSKINFMINSMIKIMIIDRDQLNERKRIQDRCSTQISTTKHQNAFDDFLRQNGYPENSIDQTKRPQNHRRDS